MPEGSNKTEEPDEPHLPLTVDSPIYWAECLIDLDALRAYYREEGIKCYYCCASGAETFAQGAKVHEGGPWGGFDAEKVVRDLNELAEKHPLDEAKYRPKGLLERLVGLVFSSEPSKSD